MGSLEIDTSIPRQQPPRSHLAHIHDRMGALDPPDASRSAAAAFAYGIGKGGRRVENDAREKAAGERMQLGSGG
jgi:hypothetical protein